MKYRIRIYGDPVLREKTETVTGFDDDLKAIVEGMIEVMYEDNGMGLAAPQVGIPCKIIVIDQSFGERVDDVLALVNPEIIETEGECVLEEGCLSVPGVYENVTRPEKVIVRFQDTGGATHEIHADGMLARIVQHEADHIEGILFIDRLSPVTRNLLSKTLRSLKEEGLKV